MGSVLKALQNGYFFPFLKVILSCDLKKTCPARVLKAPLKHQQNDRHFSAVLAALHCERGLKKIVIPKKAGFINSSSIQHGN